MKIVLFQPQIPQNTGNIVRTCAVMGAELVLVEPLGFSLKNRWLKRAGLDYWEGVSVEVISDLNSFLKKAEVPFYFFSSKASRSYHTISYALDSLLIFGSETEGLPSDLRTTWGEEKFVFIPMRPESRCLNLATSVGVGAYEVWRQHQFLNQ